MKSYTIKSSYRKLREYYNDILNKDKGLFNNSNDEPTPIECVEEMIAKIPEEIFKNEDLKILDPCCGTGNFFIPLYNKLKEEIGRKKLLEEVLHFNDINRKRLEVVNKVFLGHKYDLNVSCKDFLEFEEDVLYDLIITNPPYAKISPDGKRASKNHNLIGLFLSKDLSLLKEGGILVFITPNNWMSYSRRNKLIREITKYQLLHLDIHTAKKYFKKVGSSFTWYVLEKKPSYKDIEVECLWKGNIYKDKVKSGVRNYIPLFYTRKVQSILSKTIDKDQERFLMETSSDLHRYTKRDIIKNEADDEYKYRLLHTPSQTCWSNRAHKYQEGYKVFIGTTTYYNAFVDDCGMTQSFIFYRAENIEKAEKVAKILNHPLYKFINNICRYGNFNNIMIIKYFPLCEEFEDVYDKFGITKEEQTFIEDNTIGCK